jgi:hypothetical protein
VNELLAEREVDQQSMQLVITLAGNGWSGEAAKELFGSLEDKKREIAEQLGENEQPGEAEPKSQMPMSEEEFRRQVGA